MNTSRILLLAASDGIAPRPNNCDKPVEKANASTKVLTRFGQLQEDIFTKLILFTLRPVFSLFLNYPTPKLAAKRNKGIAMIKQADAPGMVSVWRRSPAAVSGCSQ